MMKLTFWSGMVLVALIHTMVAAVNAMNGQNIHSDVLRGRLRDSENERMSARVRDIPNVHRRHRRMRHQDMYRHYGRPSRRPHTYGGLSGVSGVNAAEYEYAAQRLESIHSEDSIQYSDRSQSVAFFLSFFVFGAGRLYVGHYVMGWIQVALLIVLLLLLSITCLISFAPYTVTDRLGLSHLVPSNPNDIHTPTGWLRQCMLITIFWIPLALIVMIWWIHDIAFFGLNDIVDGNGLPLYPDLLIE